MFSMKDAQRIVEELIELCQTPEQVHLLSAFNFEENYKLVEQAKQDARDAKFETQITRDILKDIFRTAIKQTYYD